MLVLSRKTNEAVIIPMDDGNQIEVMVVEIRGDKIRLGFSAPRGVPIHREEVWNAIQSQSQESNRATRQPPRVT